VITPGGEAISPYSFDVMVERPGRLVPPQGFAAADYDLVNHYGDAASPQTDGRFFSL